MKTMSCAAAMAALCAPVAGAASGPTVRLPAVQYARLRNGTPVVTMAYRRAPAFTLCVVFRGGSATDPAGKAGVASLTAELLARGTAKRSAEQFAQEIDYLGASIEAEAGADGVTVRASGLSRHFAAVVGLLAEMLREPAFDPDEVGRAKALRTSAIRALREDPASVAARVAQEIGWSGHPYGNLETEASLARITREDLQGFWRRTLAPPNARIVYVGSLSIAEALSTLNQGLGDWPATAVPPADPPKPEARRPAVVLVDKPDAVQSNVVLVGAGAAAGDPSRLAAEVASTILGGGFTSRLVEEVRVNRSLTYGIGCGMRCRRAGGIFSIGSFTRVPTTRALLDAIRAVVGGAGAAGFTPEELRRMVGYLAGQFAIEVQTSGALAGRLAEMELYGLPADHLTGYLSRLRGLRLADVNGAARRWFRPSALSMVVVGPASTLRPVLSRYGTVEERKPEEVGK